MARYIDADWIYEKVENRYRVSGGIEHRCERDLLDLICEAPTADVAQKSEVERLREINSLLTEAGQEWQKRYENLAREIFEEIEKAHDECIWVDITTRVGYLQQTKFEHKLAELKKKYTGDQT